MDDDKDDGVSEERNASFFDPPYDVADLKLRFSALDGRDRFEVRTGYAYNAPIRTRRTATTPDTYRAITTSGHRSRRGSAVGRAASIF